MKTLNLTRLTMGLIVIVGLLVFQPLAYFAAAMMIFAGLTGVCLLERLLNKIFTVPLSCATVGVSGSTNPLQADLSALSGEQIKQAVAEKYSQVALSPQGKFNFPVGRKFAESVGYPAEVLETLSATMWESFTGAGNPQPYADPQPGETVLDLGCGTGLDLYFYARAVGEAGKLYGLDISQAMIDKAGETFGALGFKSVEFLKAPADAVPLPDASVDLVTANGIYNLSPDKDAVMREVYRVLKPGGRTIFAEIVLKSALPKEIRRNIDDWFRCIGGALPESDFLTHLRAVGFSDVQVLWRGRNARTGHELALSAVIRAQR